MIVNDAAALVAAISSAYPNLEILSDYMIVERDGVIQLENWPENLPLPTQQQIDSSRAELDLARVKADLSGLNAIAAAQIARIQDRVDTLGYGVEAGEATDKDAAELAALTINLKAWKSYKFALGKVTTQSTWPGAPVWPTVPAIPEIAADPAALAPDTV